MEKTESDFIAELGSSSAVPGGGSASAFAGAMAAALAGMVAGLTLGKKAYAGLSEEMERIIIEAREIADRLSVLVDEDSSSYLAVMRALKLPKETVEEKTERSEAILKAAEGAALVPLETMRLSLEALKLLETVALRGNANCATDAGVGALMAAAAAEGAYLNVMINLESLKDEAKVEKLGGEADELLRNCREKAEAIRKKLFG